MRSTGANVSVMALQGCKSTPQKSRPIESGHGRPAVQVANVCSYRIAQNFGRDKLWRINRYRVFGEENVGEFTIATISYSSKPGIWLGKTLANDVRFTKFAKVFPRQSFAL